MSRLSYSWNDLTYNNTQPLILVLSSDNHLIFCSYGDSDSVGTVQADSSVTSYKEYFTNVLKILPSLSKFSDPPTESIHNINLRYDDEVTDSNLNAASTLIPIAEKIQILTNDINEKQLHQTNSESYGNFRNLTAEISISSLAAAPYVPETKLDTRNYSLIFPISNVRSETSRDPVPITNEVTNKESDYVMNYQDIRKNNIT